MPRYRQSYGCCAHIPEGLLHTGDRWDYPKWYISYICGIGDKKLPTPVRTLLDYLSDGSWERKVGNLRVGIGSIEASVELELVEMRPFQKTSEHGFIAEYRITDRGRTVLKEKSLP